MKKYLNYFYNIKVETLHKFDLKYIFSFRGSRYILEEVFCSENELEEINRMVIKLLENNIPIHVFMLNRFSNFITYINNKKYVLMKVITQKNKINFEEIIDFNCVLHVGNCKWKGLWINKIDYYDIRNLERKQNNILLKAFYNYNVAMAEMGVCLLKEKNIYELYICHRRINDNPLDFYNPFNLVVDQKSREYAEYIKYIFFDNMNKEEVVEMTEHILVLLTNYEKSNVFIRLLYNTYFFDKYEVYLEKDMEYENIEMTIKKTKEYENFLLYIYDKYISNMSLY